MSSHAHLNRELRARERDLYARLRSIEADATFVELIARNSKLPVFANLRAGAWYCERPHDTCYFKSMDGHVGCWDFSMKRLNLNVLEAVAEHGGALIVDSTTKGKKLPDALAKTVPIWAAVINQVLGLEEELVLPPGVPASEWDQINAQMMGWVQRLREANLLTVTPQKPLRALWIHADSQYWESCVPAYTELPFSPLICLSASSPSGQPPCLDASNLDGTWQYIQGGVPDLIGE